MTRLSDGQIERLKTETFQRGSVVFDLLDTIDALKAELARVEDAAEERWKARARLLMGDKDKLKAELAASEKKLDDASDFMRGILESCGYKEIQFDDGRIESVATATGSFSLEQLRLEVVGQLEALKAELAALREPMECGHPKACEKEIVTYPEPGMPCAHYECAACGDERLVIAAAIKKEYSEWLERAAGYEREMNRRIAEERLKEAEWWDTLFTWPIRLHWREEKDKRLAELRAAVRPSPETAKKETP